MQISVAFRCPVFWWIHLPRFPILYSYYWLQSVLIPLFSPPTAAPHPHSKYELEDSDKWYCLSFSTWAKRHLIPLPQLVPRTSHFCKPSAKPKGAISVSIQIYKLGSGNSMGSFTLSKYEIELLWYRLGLLYCKCWKGNDLLKGEIGKNGKISSGFSWGLLRHFPKDPWLAP